MSVDEGERYQLRTTLPVLSGRTLNAALDFVLLISASIKPSWSIIQAVSSSYTLGEKGAFNNLPPFCGST